MVLIGQAKAVGGLYSCPLEEGKDSEKREKTGLQKLHSLAVSFWGQLQDSSGFRRPGVCH